MRADPIGSYDRPGRGQMHQASGERALQDAAQDGHGVSRSQLRRQLMVGGVVVALVLALLAFFAVLGAALDKPFKVFTKEVAEQAQVASYTGFIAEVTWFLWVVALTSALLAAVVLYRRRVRDRRIAFFLCASLLTFILLSDDFAMLHEQWIPRLGIPEEALYAFYAVFLIFLIVRFRAQFVEFGILLPIAAGALWAVSVISDVIQETWQISHYIVEDGSKTMGTALWAAFMVLAALRVFSERDAAGERDAVGERDAAGERDATGERDTVGERSTLGKPKAGTVPVAAVQATPSESE